MTEIAAKRMYYGDKLIFQKPQLKLICSVYADEGSKVYKVKDWNPDFSSEFITIVVSDNSMSWIKTVKTADFLTGAETTGISGNTKTGQVISESEDTKTSTFTVKYFQYSFQSPNNPNASTDPYIKSGVGGVTISIFSLD